MKRLYFGLIISLFSINPAFSQATNCTQTLRLIRSTYEQGRLHELPKLAEACLTSVTGFSKEERKEAYRYLTLAYIYLEEPDSADAMMLNLLNTDHFYQPNKDVDPAEFQALFYKFRTEPLFRVGLTLGLNLSEPALLNSYYVGSEAVGNGSYSFKPSFNVHLVYEKDLGKLKQGVRKYVLSGEVGYVTRSFTYDNPSLNILDSIPTIGSRSPTNQKFIFSQSWLDVNVIAQYKLANTINFQTYVGVGPGISYLLSSSNLPNTFLSNGFTVTGPAVDDTEAYNKLKYSATVVAGLKYRIGDLYVTGNVRYQIGFSNGVSSASRTNPELAFAYQGSYNDYRMNNVYINVGILYPIFSPKKLVK